MGLKVVEVLKGVFRRVGILEGSTKPMSASNTTVPKWINTAPYDPLNGEVILGVDGPDRVQLSADCKLYPPLCAGGYPPAYTIVPRADGALFIVEIPGAGVNVGATGQWSKGVIVVPPTATLTIGAVAMPAPGISLSIPVNWYGAFAISSGVASSWLIFGAMNHTTARVVTSR